jgi:cellulose synthase/poly-beta-1,6-N-acetylglucosamine synthase-like glycosyltransferase
VIIAARNEERNIKSCLDSLIAQTYPKPSFEVIVVDDQSVDKTATLCLEYAAENPNIRIVPSGEETTLRGKTNALAGGIRLAKGEIIMITDADCKVPPTWIEGTVKRYGPKVGIVGGMTIQRSWTAFEGMQSLDWAYLLGIASAAVAWKHPLSTIGNNLSFRRQAYNDVGGYEKIPFSVTEDYSLFQAIVRTGKWDYLYPIDPALLVTSKPCETWVELIRQKHRWGKGGLDMKVTGFVIMALGFLMHAMILAGPILYWSVTAALTGWLVKLVGDYVFLYAVLKKINRTGELRFFHAFQLYYLLYVIALPFIVFFGRKVTWKGRQY